MKDWHLALVVAGFVAADVVLLTVVTAWESIRYSIHTIPDKEHGDTINVSSSCMYVCMHACMDGGTSDKEPSRRGQPPNKGHSSGHLSYSGRSFITSKKRTTSQQKKAGPKFHCSWEITLYTIPLQDSWLREIHYLMSIVLFIYIGRGDLGHSLRAQMLLRHRALLAVCEHSVQSAVAGHWSIPCLQH